MPSSAVWSGEPSHHPETRQEPPRLDQAGLTRIDTSKARVAAAEQAKTFVIVLMTYLVGLGGFAHVVVGSIEALFMVFQGVLPFGRYLSGFLLPTLAGNIVGGSLIFALISHAQVRSDDG